MFKFPWGEVTSAKFRGCARVHAQSSEFESSKMSVEPSRKQAYSADLRLRIVYQRIGINLPFYKIANNLNVTASTTHQTYIKFVIEGDVEPVQHNSRLELRVLDEHAELIVIGMLENPTLYLDKVVHKVAELTSIVVSPPTICRLLNAMA